MKDIKRTLDLGLFFNYMTMKHKLIDLGLSLLAGLSYAVACFLVAYIWFPSIFQRLIGK